MSEPGVKPKRRKSRERLLYTPAGFLVLLALSKGPAHGAEITRRIIGYTVGRYVSGTSLYDEIRYLEQQGLVERSGPSWKSELAITEEGRRALGLATLEMKAISNVAQKRRLW